MKHKLGRTVVIGRATVIGALLALALPAAAAAHTLHERYQAPLPLIAYIGGAALAVAMSFAFVMLRGARPAGAAPVEDVRRVPGWLRGLLSAAGLIAWLWIIVQGLFGGADPAADVGHIFLWIYGWIGLAIVSALIGPAWSWIDPFTTLHRLLSAGSRRLGLTSERAVSSAYPSRWLVWPAALGFIMVIWLELVAFVFTGRLLALVLLAYTLVTLAAMSWFGRETWRSHGEVFSVWFRLLGRLAPFGLHGDPEEGRVRRRPFAAALLRERWTTPELVLVTLATGAVIYDGLSQTQLYLDLFGTGTFLGLPPTIFHTLVAAAFFLAITAVVLGVARLIGRSAVGAGLLPVAVGYIVAHYIVALLVDGQRIIRAINDPLLRGDDLLPFPLSAHEPTLFIPVSLVWSAQLAAVVGGHVLGAWAGHAAMTHERPAARPLHQLPLAALMVAFTSVTLWTLGQEVIDQPAAAQQRQIATIAPGLDQRAVSSAASTVLMIASGRSASSL